MLVRWIQENFFLIQAGLAAGFVLAAWMFLRPRSPDSNFRVRESDRLKSHARGPHKGHDALAHAKMRCPPPPLQLSGIRLDGPAHQILGVSENAQKAEIQRAYRELMKQYHPDLVGRPDTREWNDAQRIAEAINRAKDEMLARLK